MARALCGLMVALVSVAISPGWSAAITVNPFTINMLRDVRSVNNIGIAAGDLVQYGADVQGGSAGTFISAFHSSGFTDAAVPCGPLVINANFCAGVFLFDPSRLDDWTIRFTKTGEAPLDVAAPSLKGAAAIPFPVSVTIAPGANPTTPTISWDVPAGFAPDAFRVNIFDRDAPVGINGVSAQIHSAPIPPGSTSYEVPATLSSGQSLQLNRNYTIGFQLIDLRPGFTEAQFVSSNNNALVLSRSNSFFNFRPLEGFGQINLPQVGVDPDPTDNRAAPYQFSVTEVGPDAVTFIDPPVAVGYDYAIGAGDPNFASVIFPEVGDDVFALIFGDTEVSVLAGEQFFFPLGGVAAFGVRGIEASAGLDPNDVLAFVTGLTFVGEGSFTGTMTPIIVDVTIPVPEPSLLALLGTATAPLVGLGWWTTRRTR